MGFFGILCFVACIFFASGGAEVQQTQTPGYHFTANASYVEYDFSNGNISREGAEKKNRSREGCRKSDICEQACSICDHFDKRIECYDFFVRNCFEIFNQSMSTLNAKDFCKWNNIKSPYNNFTMCTEERADCLLIPWPNKLVEIMFVNIHSNYFKSCPTQGFYDPPPSIVFALVMTPICLIPVMVVLVVMKTKNGDRRS
ncbi:hypothetical protein AAFF_G00052820 [Aldrovandia affinis]|uniref:Uncharacterized protein n=1 Tax=Aldrovandia affinis TaxID=143900 RepID=A0AAD7T5Z0_9TELE|nr:hypothetical protein AAFF_G00052820 [Aldrovandia affinis]